MGCGRFCNPCRSCPSPRRDVGLFMTDDVATINHLIDLRSSSKHPSTIASTNNGTDCKIIHDSFCIISTMAHQMATSSWLLMLPPLHSAIAALIEATPWPGRLLRFLTKRSTKMGRCKTIGFRDHRDRPWMQWRGRSSRGALEDMFGSRIWNCLLLSVGNGGCRQDAATFQQQIDNVRIVQIYLELHRTTPKNPKRIS